MDDLERAISERQENIRHLEKEVSQATERLSRAQQEITLLLAARQIVARDELAKELSLPLPLAGTTSPGMNKFTEMFFSNSRIVTGTGTLTFKTPRHEMTLVDEVKEILSHASSPIGPAEIRAELSKTGRDVPQNVMTGLLSRLWKERRVVRLERGKYRAKTEEDIIEKRETA